MNTRIVLILGARAPVALELARSFHKKDIPVILADSLNFPIGRWSRAIKRYVKLPSARLQTKKYVTAIDTLIATYAISDLIPCCEEAFYIASYKNRWSCKVWTTDVQTLDRLHNKETFTSMCKTIMAVPETISVDTFNDWEHSDQYVFKPKYSRFAGEIINGLRITPGLITEPNKWIAQKKIYGKEICVYSIWNHGMMKGFVCYEPLYRFGKGAGIFFKYTENKEIEAQVEKLGKHLTYTGQLSFDVIIDKNGPWFIECNPRGTSGAHLFNDRLAPCFLKTEDKTYPDKRNYMLLSLMLVRNPFAFLRKEVWLASDSIFRLYDPLPTILQCVSIFEIIYIQLSKGLSVLKATTYDIEWNGNEG